MSGFPVRFLSILALSLSVISAPRAQSEPVRIAGSDLLAEALAETLPAMAEARGIELSVDLAGSVLATPALLENEVDIALIAEPEREQPGGVTPAERGLRRIPLAFRISVVAVQGGNALADGAEREISGLSARELAGIFGDRAEVNIRQWSELGQTAGIGGDKIRPFVALGENRMNLNLFTYSVMPDQGLRSVVSVLDTQAEVEQELQLDSSAIGILPGLPQSKFVRPLPVSKGRNAAGENNPAFGPSPENVFHGDYPLRLPLYIVYREARARELREVLLILLSEEVSEALEAEGFIAVPEKFRLDQREGLDM
jgi:ABC-type phosphate transport system substrate-binding protein